LRRMRGHLPRRGHPRHLGQRDQGAQAPVATDRGRPSRQLQRLRGVHRRLPLRLHLPLGREPGAVPGQGRGQREDLRRLQAVRGSVRLGGHLHHARQGEGRLPRVARLRGGRSRHLSVGDERMLDAAAKDHWAQNGWLRLHGFLVANEVRDLRRWTDEIAAWPEVPGRWMRYYERREGDPGARMLARIENFVPYHEGLAALVTSPRLVALLAEPSDLIVFDAWVPHQSGPNRSAGPRRSYYLTFNAASAGDRRAAYYARKPECFPPEYERQPGVDYAARGRQFNLGNPFE